MNKYILTEDDNIINYLNSDNYEITYGLGCENNKDKCNELFTYNWNDKYLEEIINK